MSSTDPSDVVPDGLTLEDLQDRQNAHSTTPDEKRKRCPECRTTDVVAIAHHQMGPDPDHDYRCGQCCHKFDEPVRGER